MFDGKEFGEQMVEIVRSYVDRTTAPFARRIEELERQIEEYQRAAATPDLTAIRGVVESVLAALPAPRDGKSVTLDDVAPLILEAVEHQVAALPPPAAGKDADPADVERLVGEHVQRAVAALPAPEPGKDADMEAIDLTIAERVEAAVAALPTPRDGESVTLDDVAPMILEAVEQTVAALPAPEPGKDADPDEVERLVGEYVQRAVEAFQKAVGLDMEAIDRTIADRIEAAAAALPVPRDGADADMAAILRDIAERVDAAVAALPAARPGKDGVGLAGAVIDRDGNLVLTLSNGTHRDLGAVVGKDADMDALLRRIDEQVGEIPKPRDGFGLDDFDSKMMPDGRTLELSFTHGDITYTHELHFPVMIYRDVFKDGEDYQHGDVVTWGGSLWHAQRDTAAKPDSPDSGWKLAVKRGRDGKDAAK